MTYLDENIEKSKYELNKNPKMNFKSFLYEKKLEYLINNKYDKIYKDFYKFYNFNNLDIISLGDTLYFLKNFIMIQLLLVKINLLENNVEYLKKNNNLFVKQQDFLLNSNYFFLKNLLKL